MARYFVMGQVYIENNTGSVTEVGRHTAGGQITATGTGTIKIHMANGTTGSISSDDATIDGSPVNLSAGENVITITNLGSGTHELTLVVTPQAGSANTNDVNSWLKHPVDQWGLYLRPVILYIVMLTPIQRLDKY
jgi:hypothetical protein